MRRSLIIAAVSLLGCGARTDLLGLDPLGVPVGAPVEDAAPTRLDAPSEPPADDVGGDDANASPYGRCLIDGDEVLCLPGDVCHANYVVGPSPVICTPTADPSTPCGLVGCGDGCTCIDARTSTCGCH